MTVSPDQENPALDFKLELERVIHEVMELQQLPGLAIAIAREDEPLYAQGFGVADRLSGVPAAPGTLFHMASLTKGLVSIAIMQLVERGSLKLGDEVTQHLEYFRLADERYRSITIEQLLSHRSGLPHNEDYQWHEPQYHDGALEEHVRSLERIELQHEPGTRFSYSDTGYEVLGDLIAKLTGRTFEAHIRHCLLEPLGMTLSTLRAPLEADPGKLAGGHVLDEHGYVARSPFFPYNRRHAPSSTLVSNVVEMSRWAQTHLHRGELDGNRVLEPASYDDLWRRIADRGQGSAIGLGWYLDETPAGTRIRQNGQDLGFTASLTLLPDLGASIVVACNCDRAQPWRLAGAAVELLAGQKMSPLLPTRSAMSGGLGDYESSDGDSASVDKIDSQLFLGYSGERYRLHPIEPSGLEGPRQTQLTLAGGAERAEPVLQIAGKSFRQIRSATSR